MRVGDVAVLDGDERRVAELSELAICAAPTYGVTLKMTAERVVSRLVAAGCGRKRFEVSLPERIEVRRKSQSVPHQKFIEAAQAAWRRIGFVPDAEAQALTQRFEHACTRLLRERPRPTTGRPRASSR